MPVASPIRKSAGIMTESEVLALMSSRVPPSTKQDQRIVPRWLILDEIKPDPMSPRK